MALGDVFFGKSNKEEEVKYGQEKAKRRRTERLLLTQLLRETRKNPQWQKVPYLNPRDQEVWA